MGKIPESQRKSCRYRLSIEDRNFLLNILRHKQDTLEIGLKAYSNVDRSTGWMYFDEAKKQIEKIKRLIIQFSKTTQG